MQVSKVFILKKGNVAIFVFACNLAVLCSGFACMCN